tara:strand:+ start:171 stop:395 length:225 start_codon:yes stop_codon:yes gene_type:complete
MIFSYLQPSLNSFHGASKSNKHRRLYVQKKNESLIKTLLASIFFLLCIVVVPEKPSHVASICEKYNSSVACQVW